MIEITVDTRRAVVTNRELLTTGSTGIVVQYTLSEDWDGLVKVACFRNAEIEESQIDIAMGDSTQCSLPAENCDEQYVGEAVFAGIYGTDGNGNIVIPTIWVSLGGLRQGVKPGYASGPNPTPDMWAQIQAIAMNAGAENAAAAAQSASEADASAESAAGSATDAGASATAAEQSATQAANSALAASGSASSAEAAQTGAEAAQTAAEAAQTAAETAQGLAEDAQEGAEAAQASIQNMTVSSSTLAEGASATVTKTVDAETGLVNLAFGIPKGERPYVYELRPSVETILYDPNQSVGSNISPTSVKLTAMRTKTMAEQFKAYISATLYYPDGTTRTYTASNAYSLTITLPTDIYGDCYIKAYCQNDAYGMSGRYAEVEIPVIAHGVKGDTGEGVPTGGTAGQFLKKSSSTDYDTEWANVDVGVTSVNGETGAVVLDASDVGAYALPSGGIPKSDLASAVQTSLSKADTALQSAPVTSVNTQTGDVVLDAGDIGYESTTVEDELGTINSALTSLDDTIDYIAGADVTKTDYQLEITDPQPDTVIRTNNINNATTLKLVVSKGNLLCLPYFRPSGYSVNGLTFTINQDYSITVNGTATAETYYNVAYYTDCPRITRIDQTQGLQYGYYLSGCTDGSSSTYFIMERNSGYASYTTPVAVFGAVGTLNVVNLVIVVRNGVTLNNKVFYPMLALTEDQEYTSPTTPYTATVESSTPEYTWGNVSLDSGYNLIATNAGNTLSVNSHGYRTLDELQNQIDDLDSLVGNNWEGKKWVAFGTSITDNYSQNSYIEQGEHAGEHTGKYVPYLLDMSKLSESAFVNRGVPGGSINGHILYYIRYYTTDMANADLITIEGAVNDFATAVPLGQVGDTVPYTNSLLPDSTADGTFAGACYQAFTTALTNAPNAVVVLLTETTGKNHVGYADYGQLKKNDLGLYQDDYIKMTMDVAEFVGIPVINCGRDSMINAQNPQYIADHIHHTYLGGYQYAQVIWSKLKNIPLKAINLPT